jgi:hypothetical protein
MKHVIGYVVLILVFVLGAIAGGGAAFAYAQSDHASAAKNGKSSQHRRVRALSRKLDLDRDQERRVADILAGDDDESRALGRDVVDRCGQRLRDHQAHVDEEIRDVLRPDQRRRFERIMVDDRPRR